MSDALSNLLAFHRSIRAALNTFDDVVALAEDGRCDTIKISALYDFFVGPMRWHDVDERESLLARLTRVDPAFGDALREAIEEHAQIEMILVPALDHLREVARADALPDAETLRRAARQLRSVIEPHLEHEERDVFPRARAMLGESDLVEMGNEIAARRLRRQAASSPESPERMRSLD